MPSPQAIIREDFRHLVDTQHLPEGAYNVQLTATAEQLTPLTSRLGVCRVHTFNGRITLLRQGNLIRVNGQVTAKLGRICVCSLEEMSETVQECFDFFLQDVQQTDFLPGSETEGTLDAPDLFRGPELDLADQLVQQVVLAMEPYPKKQDISPVNTQYPPESDSPFAVLKKRQDKP